MNVETHTVTSPNIAMLIALVIVLLAKRVGSSTKRLSGS